MTVTYIGCTDAQIRWCNCDDPRGLLTIGQNYEIWDKEIHSWHTKIELQRFRGKKFNSVCFRKMPGSVPSQQISLPGMHSGVVIDDLEN